MAVRKYLFIDACNVILSTDSLKEALQKNMDAARDQLAEMVRPIHDAEGVRVDLILDSRSDQLQVKYPYGDDTFQFRYAPADLTADGVIEQALQKLQKVKHSIEISVVSNDNLVREATRASGAIALRPEALFEWARRCENRLSQAVVRRVKSNDKEFENPLNIPWNK